MPTTSDEAERSFLFTDIEGSTQLWERFPAEMRGHLARHDGILRDAIAARGGEVFKTVGDAFCAAFRGPEDAVLAAVEAQRGLVAQDWKPVGAVRVRMAVHCGEAERRDDDYFGPPLNRVARLRDAAHGGQVLVSKDVAGRLGAGLPGVALLERGQHRLKDLPEPVAIFQVAATGLPGEFPPLRTLSAHPNNLPAETTTFVGREAEVRAVRDDLLADPDVRLVTLTGPGGTGKTRLALQAAEDVLERFPQGVWFVDLSPLREPDAVMPAVARACGIEDDAARSGLDLLCEHFRWGKALLVLDSFEQVEDAADGLMALLRACPKLQVLVTSRVLLNLSVEHEYEVPPLRPDESVRLFAARARQVRSSFAVTDENRADVAAICAALDGVPLAVELAAAQVRSLGPAEIRDALGRRLQMLSTKMRDLPPRHRSLRSAIDWSYDLLGGDERQLFRALSVFVGGFTEESARAVCGGACGPDDAFGMLESLRQRSLVRREREGERRFTLQESLRQYAAERAEQIDGAERLGELRDRHAGFFLDWAAEKAARIQTGDAESAAALDADAPNLNAGMERALEAGRFEDAARYGVALRRFWHIKGRLRDGQALLNRAAERADAIDDVRLRAQLVYAAAYIAQQAGNLDWAVACYEESRRLSESAGDAGGAMLALLGLGTLAYARGDLDRADDLYERSLALARELGDRRREAALLNNLGVQSLTRGDYDRAESLLRESLAMRERLQDEVSAAQIWNALGAVAEAKEQLDAAHDAFRHSLGLCEKLGTPIEAAYARINLGSLALRRGRVAEAEGRFSEALEVLEPMEQKSGVADCLVGLSLVAAARGDFRAAARRCVEGLTLHRRIGDKRALAVDLEALAEVALGLGKPERARTFLAVAERLRAESGARRTPHEVERVRALAALAGAGDEPAATPGLEDAFHQAAVLA